MSGLNYYAESLELEIRGPVTDLQRRAALRGVGVRSETSPPSVALALERHVRLHRSP
jgi:hypothetical protein